MPRRPTRSQSDTPTRKELARRLDDLGGEDEDYSDVPKLTLAELLSYETETVEEYDEFTLVRVVDTGELRRLGTDEGDLATVLGNKWREELEAGPDDEDG